MLALGCKRLHEVLEELCYGWDKGVLSPNSALSQITPTLVYYFVNKGPVSEVLLGLTFCDSWGRQ